MIIVVKLKSVIKTLATVALCAAAVAVAVFAAPLSVAAIETSGTHTVVLDAGHGGVDAGVIGIASKVKESTVNLQITRRVARLLTRNNINVVLTRNSEKGLYGDSLDNFKRRDMAERKRIILEAKPSLMVSIHCNKFPDGSRRGAQVFFEANSASSKALASALQAPLNLLNEEQIARSFDSLKGDYYMLHCTTYPSAIVECGFLSNLEDDKLLNDKAYQEKISYQIFSGIISFLKADGIYRATGNPV